VGLIWVAPWLPFFSMNVDGSKVEPSQEPIKVQPEQQPAEGQPRGEEALKDAPLPKEEGVSNDLPPSPPYIQPSLPSLSLDSSPRMQEPPNGFLSLNDYWDY
jgi:hypothetical protein